MPYYPGSGAGATFGPWTPALIATTTPPNLGASGVIAGRYALVGDLVVGRCSALFGGAGVNAGSGTYLLSLPVAPRVPADDGSILGVIWAYDASATRVYVGMLTYYDATHARMRIDEATNFVTNSSPVTWAAGDNFMANFSYERAV